MQHPWSTVLRDYPHTLPLKRGDVAARGVPLEFVEVEPVNHAFGPMVRRGAFDVCELAIATLFQAVEAGVPVVALPVVLHGNFHHRSLSALAGGERLAPEDLAGRRVGVRAYSQTTGLWVRGFLAETYGVSADDVTWVTREGPHVAQAVDPSNVERTDARLADLLRSGDVAAVVMGSGSADFADDFAPLLPDVRASQERYDSEHGWVPINHLAVVRRDLVEREPEAVLAVYDALTRSVDAARTGAVGDVRERVVEHGPTETMRASLATALRYAEEQHVIGRAITVDELFDPFMRMVRG